MKVRTLLPLLALSLSLVLMVGCSQNAGTQPVIQLNPAKQTPRQQVAGYTALYNLATVGVSLAHVTGNLTGPDYATAQTDLQNEGKAIVAAQAWVATNPAIADTPGVQYPNAADIILTPLLNNFALAAPLLPPVSAATQPAPIPSP